MERVKTLTQTFLLFLLLVLKIEGKLTGAAVTPRPVCASQYALANYACSMIPYSPLPPPAPSTPSLDANHHHGRHHHGHGGHRHRHRHHGTQEEEDCCRWLYEIDTDCVCDMLVHLPDFLSRPVHEYTLVVGDTCNVTYTCGGRVIRK
ncbi:Bifunctional inhibitor/plant lipid transfer protein/seed storage helical domain containing protein [Parasponia andersonii]|uniref:Bifunctional inhibitor/plant lipid transfer protein/seed storage helical domain containing protein n=1 Tax=Parasponia andersonii TaxID=3476 RepID=A0A2P5CXK7_PARAD|nr:Bifunctional inhibitor/plant lipid transfer protein/seed storage helical domain containing protein [Parasponia andersonii]